MEKKLLDLSADYAALRDHVREDAEYMDYEDYAEQTTPGAQERLDAIAKEYGATLKAFLLA